MIFYEILMFSRTGTFVFSDVFEPWMKHWIGSKVSKWEYLTSYGVKASTTVGKTNLGFSGFCQPVCDSPPGPLIVPTHPELGVTFKSYCLHWRVDPAPWASLPLLKSSKIMENRETPVRSVWSEKHVRLCSYNVSVRAHVCVSICVCVGVRCACQSGALLADEASPLQHQRWRGARAYTGRERVFLSLVPNRERKRPVRRAGK